MTTTKEKITFTIYQARDGRFSFSQRTVNGPWDHGVQGRYYPTAAAAEEAIKEGWGHRYELEIKHSF